MQESKEKDALMVETEIQYMEDLEGACKREEILWGLEEAFKRGMKEIRSGKAEKGTEKEKEELFRRIYIPRRGDKRWETERAAHIKELPLAPAQKKPLRIEKRGPAFKVQLKEPIEYINSLNGHLLVVTEKGCIKIYKAESNWVLEKEWEMSGGLFTFLLREKRLSVSVADVLTQVLIMMHRKGVKEIEKVFQELILFTKASAVKKGAFINGYLCMVSAFKDMQIFDESLREIPLGTSTRGIIASILKDTRDKAERVNKPVKKEVCVSVGDITIHVLKNKIKMVYAKKTVYEEIKFKEILQVLYTDNILFLREGKSILHVIMLNEN